MKHISLGSLKRRSEKLPEWGGYFRSTALSQRKIILRWRYMVQSERHWKGRSLDRRTMKTAASFGTDMAKRVESGRWNHFSFTTSRDQQKLVALCSRPNDYLEKCDPA